MCRQKLIEVSITINDTEMAKTFVCPCKNKYLDELYFFSWFAKACEDAGINFLDTERDKVIDNVFGDLFNK